MKRLLFALTVLLLAACSVEGQVSPEVGAIAPDFELQNLEGEMVRLRDLRGQPVLINFWATWCGPCREEMPAIEARYNERGDFAVLAVDFGESAERVSGYLAELGVDLPVVLDKNGDIQDLYRVRGYPTTYFVDSQGVIRFFHIGQMSAADIDSILNQMDQP